jgi:subtilisin-like proprotein convertase family protein
MLTMNSFLQNSLRKCLLWLFVVFMSSPLWAQNVQNYTITAGSNESLVEDAAGWTQLIGANSFSSSAVTNIGFEVWFMGERFTQFSVNTNGVFRFGGTAVVAAGNAPGIPDNARICAFAAAAADDDVKWRTESNGSVRYKIVGTAPNRRLVVDWNNMRVRGNETHAENGISRWQIHVYETAPDNANGGVARVIYGRMRILQHAPTVGCGNTGDPFTSTNMGIGYGTGATQVVYINTDNHPTISSSYGTQLFACNGFGNAPTNITSLNSTTNTTRRFYNFNPPLPNGNVDNLVISCISSNSVQLNWSENATNEVGIVIYRSTDNVNFTFLTQLPANTTGFLNTGLVANTTYYYRVFTVTEGRLSAITPTNVGSMATLAVGEVRSIGSNTWTTAANWSSAGIPTAAQNTTIGCVVPHTVTVNAAGDCNDLTIETNSVLNFNANQSVHARGNLYNHGIINLNTGTTLRIDGYVENFGTINVNGGTLIVNGNFLNTATAVLDNGTGTIRLRRNFTNQGSFNSQTGNFHFDGNNNQVINHTGQSSASNLVAVNGSHDNPTALVTPATPTSYTNNTAINIPDNNATGINRTITVPATAATITGITLNLNINHTWVGDLIVRLTSPSGTTRTLIDRPGVPNTAFGCSGDNIVVLLSDAAALPVENQCAAGNPTINGTFSPNQTLAAFIGENPTGNWIINISDNAGGDTGSFQSASLNINTTADASTPGLSIPDNNNTGVNHVINVPTVGTVQYVTLDLGIDHTYIGDLRVTLTSPDGTTRVMFNRPANGTGTCSGDNILVTLDDAAATAMQAQCGAGVPSVSGTHSPQQTLAAFIGENSAGNWTINVSDRAGGDIGRLMSATLHITTGTTEVIPLGNELYFHRFFMENTSAGGVRTQNADVYIAQNATWTNGIFYADNDHRLRFINGATSTIPNDNSYADVWVHKVGNQAFDFPTGNDGYAGVIGMSAPSDPTHEFEARYIRQTPHPLYDRSLKEETIHHVSNCEYWYLNRLVGASAVSVRLSYDDVRSCGVGDPSALKVCRWDGSEWIDHFNGGNFGAPYTGLVSSGAIASFSPFTLGSEVTEDINPLPVSWLTFEANRQGEVDAILDWTTGQEVDNSHFVVERSANGIKFEAVARIEAQNLPRGAADQHLDYRAALHAEQGLLYYRIRQVDFSGAESYSPVRQVRFEKADFQFVAVMPNPFSNTVKVAYQLPASGEVQLRIVDMMGRTIWNKIESQTAGLQELEWNGSHLAKGTYLIQIAHGSQIITTKVVKED